MNNVLRYALISLVIALVLGAVGVLGIFAALGGLIQILFFGFLAIFVIGVGWHIFAN